MHRSRSGPKGGTAPAASPVAPQPRPGPAHGLSDVWQAFGAGWEVWSAGTVTSSAAIEQRSRDRLDALLVAAQGSPLYRRLHGAAAARTGVPLASLPPVTRAELMADFDDWCTDAAVTRDALRAFLADPLRIGTPFLGRYAVWTSSGTSGEPGVYVHDRRALAVYDALQTLRFRGVGQPGAFAASLVRQAMAGWSGGERFAMLGATGGHFAGIASVERLRRLGGWAAARMRMVSIVQPLDRIVAELQAFGPTVLATYPTAADLLAAEQAAGRLRLRLSEVWTGGEQLAAPVRARIEQAFGCRLRNAYGASEFIAIGAECGHGAIHVNADWVILEPVDRQHRPVAPGVASHTVLLTNLANHVQPLIRYDLGDSVTLLAGCACGSALPAIHVEGRSDDPLEFDSTDGVPVRLLPLALVGVIEDEAGVADFQLEQTDARTLVLRIGRSTADPPAARRACRDALQRFLAANRIARIRLVDDPRPPLPSPISGKLRRTIRGVAAGNAGRG